MKKFFRALLASTATCLAFAAPAPAQNLAWHYVAPHLNGIEGHTAYGDDIDRGGGTPRNKTVCRAGQGMLNDPIGWNVGHFSGYDTGEPYTQYQRGYRGNEWGTTSCQVKGTEMSFWQNSGNWVSQGTPSHGMQNFYWWADGTEPRPWAAQYGSNAKLRVQADIGVPVVSDRQGGKVHQIVQLNASLLDASTNQAIFFNVEAWSNDPNAPCAYGDDIRRDTTPGTGVWLVGSCFRNSTTRYSETGGHGVSAGPGPMPTTWLDFKLSREQLQNIVSDINAEERYQRYSPDPANWKLTQVYVNSESWVFDDAHGNFATYSKNLMAMTEY